MPDVQIRAGGAPTDSLILVNTDGETITGDGSIEFPLRAIAGEAGAPARTLYVASSWSGDVDPAVYFTTIDAAIAQAATMSPSASSPIGIMIADGTYSDNLVLQSWVFLAALTASSVGVTISGNVSWTPTAGSSEGVNLTNLNLTGTLTVNATGKSGGQSSFLANNCVLGGTFTGRATSGTTRDYVQLTGCTTLGLEFSTYLVEYLGGNVSPLTFNGACVGQVVGCSTVQVAVGSHAINGTSAVTFTGCALLAIGLAVASGASATVTGCNGTGNIAVSSGGTADLRMTNFGGDSKLAGPGTINRTTFNFSFGPTTPGANSVVFTIPFPDANYNVLITLTGGTGNADTGVSAKAGTGFTLTDSAGSNTYNITIVHD